LYAVIFGLSGSALFFGFREQLPSMSKKSAAPREKDPSFNIPKIYLWMSVAAIL
jgi:hypothetical protein